MKNSRSDCKWETVDTVCGCGCELGLGNHLLVSCFGPQLLSSAVHSVLSSSSEEVVRREAHLEREERVTCQCYTRCKRWLGVGSHALAGNQVPIHGGCASDGMGIHGVRFSKGARAKMGCSPLRSDQEGAIFELHLSVLEEVV